MARATKKQLAEQVMRIVQGGHIKPDNPMDIRELMLYVDQLRDEYIRATTVLDPITGVIAVSPEFLSYYESVAIATDVNKGNIKYSTLPAHPIDLPGNIGIYSISPMTALDNQFIPVKPTSSWLYKNTMAYTNTAITEYYTVADKVFYRNVPAATTTVLMAIVASSKDILETASFPMSPDGEAHIIRELLKLFGVQQQAPHDETENGQKNG